jgi:hypothetical protein
MIEKNWTPVKKGLVYCSPACGHNCTKAAFDKATKSAEALAKTLGRGWVPSIWENLGWHYAVNKDFTSIHPPYRSKDGGGTYTAYLNAEKQFVCSAKTANAAYKGVLKNAHDFITKLTEDMEKQING